MTGIICAMQIEADGIIALSQNTQTEEIAGMKFTTGTLNGKDIAVVVCGVGKVNAAMCAVVLIEKFNPDVVINSGVGGSLSPLVSIGDIVVATKSVQHDMNTTALGDRQGEVSFPDGTKLFFDCAPPAAAPRATVNRIAVFIGHDPLVLPTCKTVAVFGRFDSPVAVIIIVKETLIKSSHYAANMV